MRSGSRDRRPAAFGAALAAAVALLVLGTGVAPASAATVTDAASLTAALQPGTDAVITLGGPVTVTDQELTIPRTVTLDLAGFDLTTAAITLAAGVTFTITDSTATSTTMGTVRATSPVAFLAGIGVDGANLVIDDGRVLAQGGNFSAAIGGRDGGAGGGTVVIDGGAVVATGGGVGGSGIGSGWGAGAIDVTIRAGVVTATGGYNAAGIGGGGGNPSARVGVISIEGGVVTAQGGDQGGAGIGSGVCASAAGITISGGTVTATGGANYGAGIGAGLDCGGTGSMGTIVIDGGTVSATGGYFASGIGGGSQTTNGSLAINGGAVTAKGGSSAPALGGMSVGGAISVGASATATAIAGTGGTAIGPIFGSDFGPVNIAGRLILPAGSELSVPASAVATVASGGRITGDGALSGAGAVDNHGAITLPDANVTVADITDHNYVVIFDPQVAGGPTGGARVLASTFTQGGRIFPPDPVSAPRTFLGWNTASDGSGAAFTAGSTLAGSATAGPLLSSVYGQWSGYLVLTPADTTTTAGDTIAFSAEEFTGAGDSLGDVTAQTTLVSSNGAADPVTGHSIRFIVAAPSPGDVTTVSAHLTADPTIMGTTTVAVAAAEAVSMTLTPSDSAVDQGDTVTLAVTGVDGFGNAIHDLDTKVDVTSDHAGDVISGMSVRFPGASTHLLTVTLRSNPAVSASATVVVRPAAAAVPGQVALTGSDPTLTIALGASLLSLGVIAAVAAALRRRRSSPH
ncbi:MAG TPA: hypothetical protein VGO65_02280 [Pseudolysinimonas sp.]|nr:hypothetical protein [Pseudolysinimonas sp.]